MSENEKARAPGVTDAVRIPCAMSGLLEVLTVYPVGKGGVTFCYGDDASVIVDGDDLLKLRAIIDQQIAHPPAAEREAPGGVVPVPSWIIRKIADAVAWDRREGSRLCFGSGDEPDKWAEYVEAPKDAVDAIVALAAAPPPPANIEGDSPSVREMALREALRTAHAAMRLHGWHLADASSDPGAEHAQEAYDAVDAAILTTPAEGQGDE